MSFPQENHSFIVISVFLLFILAGIIFAGIRVSFSNPNEYKEWCSLQDPTTQPFDEWQRCREVITK